MKRGHESTSEPPLWIPFRSPHCRRMELRRPRNEHRSPGYAPFGLCTYTCLGSRWLELQLAVNVLMVSHYFTLEVSPAKYSLKFSPILSMKPSKNLKFCIAGKRRDLPV